IPTIVGTLGKSSLIAQVVNATKLDVSGIDGNWESFLAKEVENPLPGVERAYVIIGADKRGTIFAIYEPSSEQFGTHPFPLTSLRSLLTRDWSFRWADVPAQQHPELYVASTGCSHGTPTVKYRGIFINDEQPALQNFRKFTNGTTSSPLGSPFNHLVYVKMWVFAFLTFELLSNGGR
ncbi:hypothetical protein C0991_000387, partial [Blastosporella zonata]